MKASGTLRGRLLAGAVSAVWLASLACSASLVQAADPNLNPFAAHNAYPWRLYGNDRLPRALDAGLRHVEIDITYDPKRQVVVATHDSTPNGREPELAEVLEPVWERWGDKSITGRTLILDFKTSSPEIVAGVEKIFQEHAELLSRMPKAAGGKFEERGITVCLTGDTAAHRRYADGVPDDGDYLAFGDHGSGAWKEDIARYVPSEPAGFVRFLTYEKQTFMDSPDAKGNDHISTARIGEAVRLANERGYRIRVYTINPVRREGGLDDAYWAACVEGGVHMIATDAYEIARDWWRERPDSRSDAPKP